MQDASVTTVDHLTTSVIRKMEPVLVNKMLEEQNVIGTKETILFIETSIYLQSFTTDILSIHFPGWNPMVFMWNTCTIFMLNSKTVLQPRPLDHSQYVIARGNFQDFLVKDMSLYWTSRYMDEGVKLAVLLYLLSLIRCNLWYSGFYVFRTSTIN